MGKHIKAHNHKGSKTKASTTMVTRSWEVGSLGRLLVHAAATVPTKGKAARVILGVAQTIQRAS